MIRIAVLDDEKYFINKIKSLADNLFYENGFDCETSCFTSTTEFIKKYSENSFNVVFLDIEHIALSAKRILMRIWVK